MKTNSSYSLLPFQAVQHNLKGGGASVLASSFVLTTAVVALLLMATCTTTNAANKVAGGAAPLADDLRFQLGKVALAPDPKPARFSFDKADGQIADAADAANTAAGNMLATTGPDLVPKELEGLGALVQAPVQVATFLLAPGAAVKGATDARKRMAPDQLSACERNLRAAMSEMAVQRRFHEQLLKAANEKCSGRLVSLGQAPTARSNTAPPDSVLEARVEELRLERTGARDTSFRLRIKAQMRLTRVADGQVLYDEPAEYQSGKCLFADWTLPNAFQGPAETGYYLLAQQCASRLLAITDQPAVAGVGYRKAGASNWPRAARPVSADAWKESDSVAHSSPALKGTLSPSEGERDGVRETSPFLRPNSAPASSSGVAKLTGGQLPWTPVPAQFVSQPMPSPGTLGIYSTGTVAHVVIQRPLTRDEAGSEALSDVDHMVDGLNQHPNLLVAVPAAAVATPISLWKQGAAVVRGLSPRKAREVEAKLTQAASETRPHEELAFQVAQHLAPRTSQPVMLVRQPLPPAVKEDVALMQWAAHGTLASLTGGQTASGYLLSQGADTALEIHVQDARLAGQGEINPKLALCVEARATLVRSRDGQPVYSCPVHYRSPARKSTAWAANDAKLFREELQRCYQSLGEAVTEQLVARGVVPPDRKPQPTFAGK